MVFSSHVCMLWYCVFFFKQKTAYEMRISDWSSDVCSSDLGLDSVVGVLVASLIVGILGSVIPGYLDELAGGGTRDVVTSLVILLTIMEIGRARVGKECVSTCRSRWSPYH